MQNLIFLLLLVTANACFFLLFDDSLSISKRISRKMIGLIVVPVTVLLIILLTFNPTGYTTSFYMTIAVAVIMMMRFVIYKLLSTKENRSNPAGHFFDRIIFPFFVLFISFAQCMHLLVWAE